MTVKPAGSSVGTGIRCSTDWHHWHRTDWL